MTLKNLLSVPLSYCYKAGVFVYHTLYDEHLLRSSSVGIPTVCVGNLAVGGTGKTPHVEHLLRLFEREGIQAAVLSRGYMRKTKGFLLADDTATALTIGDEPMQIHCKFPHVPVAVCENRVRGVRRLMRRVAGLQVVVLDDAFQHRRIQCGLNILLTDYSCLYMHDHMLPWGRLRDLTMRAAKANIIVVSKCPETMQPIDKRVVYNTLQPSSYQQLYFTAMRQAPVLHEGHPLVVACVANPDYFKSYVQSCCSGADFMLYPDHHYFSAEDVKDIQHRLRSHDFLLTTEKDLQRMRLTQLAESGDKPLVALPLDVTFLSDEDLYEKQVLRYVNEALRDKHL